MLLLGSFGYASYFLVGLPMFVRIDRDEPWTLGRTSLDACATCMMILALLEIWAQVIGPLWTEDDPDGFIADESGSSEFGSESSDVEFRAAGDSLQVDDFSQKCCRSVGDAGVTISTDSNCNDQDFVTYPADGCPSIKVPTICLPCGVDIAETGNGWHYVGAGSGYQCNGTSLYAAAGDEFQLHEDNCNAASLATPGDGDKDGCIAHTLADGCSADESTSWRLDGSAGVQCCVLGTGNGMGGNGLVAGVHYCTPNPTGSDTCASMDIFTTPAVCIPCETYTDDTVQGGGQDEDDSTAGRGGWDLIDSGNPNSSPDVINGEWSGSVACLSGTTDEPDGTSSDCHYALYHCRGDLRDATTGVVLDWTTQDECGAD
jgi:hypothetical protein